MHIRQLQARLEEMHRPVFGSGAPYEIDRAYRDLMSEFEHLRARQEDISHKLRIYQRTVQDMSERLRNPRGMEVAHQVGVLRQRIETQDLEGLLPEFSDLSAPPSAVQASQAPQLEAGDSSISQTRL